MSFEMRFENHADLKKHFDLVCGTLTLTAVN
jgi:hypothetical protein